MDFEKPTSAWIHEDYTEPKPESVFEMMEILLPDARYSPEAGRGRLLEIWAKKSQERRTGWISVHELKTMHAEDMSGVLPVPAVDSIAAEDAEPAVLAEQTVSPTPASTPTIVGDDDGSSLDEAILAEIANDDMEMDM